MGRVKYLGTFTHTIDAGDSDELIAELHLADPEGQITSLWCQGDNNVAGAGSYALEFVASSWPSDSLPSGFTKQATQYCAIGGGLENATADTSATVVSSNRCFTVFSTGESGGILPLMAPWVLVYGTCTPDRTGTFTYHVWGLIE
jgi:hypothetical protein